MYDIVPDIHGQAGKLEALLARLGWRRTAAGWANDAPGRELVFLGDFIDRGPENRAVIRTVRSLIDAGKARAVMGNHELNSLHFHRPDPTRAGAHLRPHTPKNLHQHATFLREYPLGDAGTREVLDWMATLPLFLETESFRAVHACWDEAAIAGLAAMTGNGVLSGAQIARAADRGDPLWRLVETVTKGPEAPLPTGYSFRDKDGTERDSVRVQWWKSGASSWADLAMSVPDPGELPVTAPPARVQAATYPADAKPVFFGHYWLTGAPLLQAPNALCLDYSAGTDGPLLAYRIEEPAARLSLRQVLRAPDAPDGRAPPAAGPDYDAAERELFRRPSALRPTAPRMIAPTSTSRT